MRLLARARAAGLTVELEGGELVIRGPRRLDGLAQELLTYGAEVALTLRAEAARVGLLEAASALGFPRLPIRPAVAVLAGEPHWGRFVAHGTDEDVVAARTAIAAAQRGVALRAEEGQRHDPAVATPSGATGSGEADDATRGCNDDGRGDRGEERVS